MKLPTTMILTLSAALAFGGGTAFADDTKKSEEQAQPGKEKPCFVLGAELNDNYTVRELDGEQRTFKSYLDKADVTVICFLKLDDLLSEAVFEKDEWINEKTQSTLMPRLRELKRIMQDEKIKTAQRSVAYVVVIMTDDAFDASHVRRPQDQRTLRNLIETYFDEHEVDCWVATTPQINCAGVYGLEKEQLATIVVQRGRVEFSKLFVSKAGAAAEAKRLKEQQEARPNPRDRTEAERLEAEEAEKLAKAEKAKGEVSEDLHAAVTRIVLGKGSVPASAKRTHQDAVRVAEEARKKALKDAEKAKDEAKDKAEAEDKPEDAPKGEPQVD